MGLLMWFFAKSSIAKAVDDVIAEVAVRTLAAAITTVKDRD